MNIVTQKDDLGCGIACVAMVAGISYEEAASVMPEHCRTGTFRIDQIVALKSLGFRCIHYLPAQIAPGRVFIIGVPSLNMAASSHDIVIDWSSPDVGAFILDPNTGRCPDRKVYGHDADLKSYGEVIEVLRE